MKSLSSRPVETLSPLPATFINPDWLASFDLNDFKSREPFPWHDFHQFLTPEGFATLSHDFPSLDCFEKHNGISRGDGQRPHDRYYLAYENSIYQTSASTQGVIKHQALAPSWQAFLQELETNLAYQRFLKTTLAVPDYKLRYAWHVGFTGSEVSPHVDTPEKIGTHILYFNTQQDWQPEWGGELLVLSGKQTPKMNPEFTDFTSAVPVPIWDNHSFFFRNYEHSWHGVKPLTCPTGSYRRLFNIIVEYSPTRKKLQAMVKPIYQILPGLRPLIATLRK
jgi:Rps23 Pro-64 3,4-dihydroxylase Tpa1-like proline 4-hydroxylase